MNRVGAELVRTGHCAEARPLLAAATVGLEKTVGAEHTDLGESLALSGACELADGHAGIALPLLERAIAIEENADEGLIDRGMYRFVLARALWALGRRAEALAAAHAAEGELAADADGARDLAELRRWHAARGARAGTATRAPRQQHEPLNRR